MLLETFPASTLCVHVLLFVSVIVLTAWPPPEAAAQTRKSPAVAFATGVIATVVPLVVRALPPSLRTNAVATR